VSQLFAAWPASMRNLLNIYQAISEVSSSEAPDLPLAATAWCAKDSADSYESLLCVFGPSENSAVIDLKRLERRPCKNAEEPSWHLCDVASWDAPCPTPDLMCDKVLDAHYFGGERVACLVLAGGDIVVVREEPHGGQDKIEVVGSVDIGIKAAAWSPDEEILSICTCGETFILMTRGFEVLTNLVLSPDDLQASKHVSVGWGKSETQFKGKRAKALHDPTMPERVDEGRLSPFDRGNVQISWRGDGAYVAVSNVEASKRRLIRVYSRDGILDSVSEPVDGLEGALAWRPAGNLIAGVQRLQDRIEVVFFERNGLRHGQFDLRLTPEEMVTWASDIELRWNGDSTVLAVCFRDRVQLWTMGNYHYYLKQQFRPPTPKDTLAVATLLWHPEAPLQLAISLGGNYSTS
jgi:elongator complex protein 1